MLNKNIMFFLLSSYFLINTAAFADTVEGNLLCVPTYEESTDMDGEVISNGFINKNEYLFYFDEEKFIICKRTDCTFFRTSTSGNNYINVKLNQNFYASSLMPTEEEGFIGNLDTENKSTAYTGSCKPTENKTLLDVNKLVQKH